MRTAKPFAIYFFFLVGTATTFAQPVYTVYTKQVKAPIPSTLWGIFFEDINRAADGGVYAEMVENRSFDFPKPMTAWETWPSNRLRDGIFMVVNQSAENPADPKYMAVHLRAGDTVGLINSGFDEGMAFHKDSGYALTLQYRQPIPGVHIRLFLFSGQNKVIGHTELALSAAAGDWQQQQVKITASDSASQGKLLVIFEGEGHVDIDRISLFPTDTWKGRPGGLRKDLVQALADLHPGFLRFPGGCIVEGNQIVHRYQWKHTIGPLQDRQMVQSIWADDVPERQTPDYMESFGLGFYEYFQLCEDIGAAPLGVGNENWGPQYAERLNLFTKRIKDRYPDIKLVNATGYSRNIPVFTYMDSVLRARKADIIDEHFYETPKWFLQNATRYDSYDRSGPRIFVGEYAAQSIRIGNPNNVNNLLTALSEAAFMTGIERNADVVTMASYAPLFAHVTGWQWAANLIWFDNTRAYNTPNYYVQQLFSVNKGTAVLPLLLDGKPVTGQDSCWASAVIDQQTNELIVKLVNMSGTAQTKTIACPDARLAKMAVVMTLQGDLGGTNNLEHPDHIAPVSTAMIIKGKSFPLALQPYSLTIVLVTCNP